MPVRFRSFKFSNLQIAVHLVFWAVIAWLAYDALVGNLGVNPIQMAEQRTGRYALYFLVGALACTPLNTLFGFRQALTARRTLGLYAFSWAVVHVTVFLWLDYDFNWQFLYADLYNKLYIFAGLTALTILTPLAITSTKWWQKRLGKNWKRLHKLIYLAAPVVVLHYSWARKGDIFSLRGDVARPLAFGLVVVLLLIARLPFVRRSAVALRMRLKNRLFPAAEPHAQSTSSRKKEEQDRPAASPGD